MKFLIYAADKPDSLHIRKANRDAHLAFLKEGKDVQVLSAGPWLDAQGEMAGSLVIVEAESQETVTKWLTRDPYAAAGLTARAEVKPFIWAIGAP